MLHRFAYIQLLLNQYTQLSVVTQLDVLLQLVQQQSALKGQATSQTVTRLENTLVDALYSSIFEKSAFHLDIIYSNQDIAIIDQIVCVYVQLIRSRSRDR